MQGFDFDILQEIFSLKMVCTTKHIIFGIKHSLQVIIFYRTDSSKHVSLNTQICAMAYSSVQKYYLLIKAVSEAKLYIYAVA